VIVVFPGRCEGRESDEGCGGEECGCFGFHAWSCRESRKFALCGLCGQ
jgi:hypothetical protein